MTRVLSARRAKLLLVGALMLAALAGIGMAFVTIPTLRGAVDYAAWLWTDGHRSMTRGLVDVRDASLYYQRSGHGPTIVLLHGGGVFLDVFFAQIPHLAQRFDVIAIDTRGHGRSTRGIQPLTYRLMADDVSCALRRLGVERASFIGWSDGGITSMFLALYHPTQVQGLVLISANFDPSGLRDTIEQESTEPGLIAQLFYRWFSPEPKRWRALGEELAQLWRSRPRLTTTDLARIAVPTLIIVGENDLIDLDHAQTMRSIIPGARLHILPGASHGLLWEQPGEINQQIETFFHASRNSTDTKISSRSHGGVDDCPVP